ncbi:hypothetical protein NX059_003403 [Plenodomus lindquistii]|nr:hypothetical protein NX059_003403 [Plenodomus lindquistii]
MRRPPIACQRAAQVIQSPSSQHAWISEDQLSIAINRFFRATCPHQKRHGSNVPGPLEARRRAAKRRMTISAGFYPQENSPSPFSLRALFGFRGRPVPSWQYQPPSLRRDAAPVDDSLSTPDATWTPTHEPTIEPTIESTHPTNTQASTQHTRVSAYEAAQTIRVNLKKKGERITAKDKILADGNLLAATRDEPPRTDSCFNLFKTKIARATASNRDAVLKVAFESCRPSGANAWKYNVRVFKYLLDNRWDPTLLLAFAKDGSLLFTLPPTYTPAHQDLVECVEKALVAFPKRIPELRSLLLRLAEAAANDDASSNDLQDANVIALCRQLWQFSLSPRAKHLDEVREALCNVASKVQNHHTGAALRSLLAQFSRTEGVRPAIGRLVSRACKSHDQYLAAADVLRCMPLSLRIDIIPMFTHFLIRASSKVTSAANMYREQWATWLRILCLVGKENALDVTYLDAAIAPLVEATFRNDPRKNPARRVLDCTRSGNLLHALLFKFTEQDALYAASKTRLARSIDAALRSISEQGELLQPEAVVVTVVHSLKKASLPHSMFTSAIAAFLTQGSNFTALVRFLNILRDQRVRLVDTSIVSAAVQRRLVALQQQPASLSNAQLQLNALTLRNCRIITSILNKAMNKATPTDAKHEMVASTTSMTLEAQRQAQHILNRANATRALPLVFRDLSAKMTMEYRVTLVHQLAHQYSIDKTRTRLEVWRALYYLYRHLKEHSATIGPLFSRAVVRTGIIRPLSEHQFVSARRLIWVCNLVARVEGEEVAKKIESDFWLWRGNLIKHAKHVHDTIGADRRDKAHIGSLKRLGIL